MRIPRPLVALVVLAVAFLVPPRAARAGEDAPVDPTPWLGEGWYGIYMGSTKSGWARMVLSRGEREGKPVFVSEMEMTLLVKSMGKKSEMRMTGVTVFDATGPQALLEERSVQRSGNAPPQEAVGRRTDAGFEVVTRRGEEETGRRTVPAPKQTLRDALAVNLLAIEGAAVGTRGKSWAFDVDEASEAEDEYEVTAVEEGFTDGLRTRVLAIRVKDGSSGLTGTARVAADGRVLELQVAGLMRLRLEPEALAKDIEYSADLFVKGMLRPDRRLGEPGKVRRLEFRLRGVDPEIEIRSDARETVTREADGALHVLVVRDAPRDGLAAATPEEIARHSRPTQEHPSHHDEIRALARQAAGDAATPEERVRRLVSFVDRYVEDSLTADEGDTALDVLRAKKGDCTEHTTLFVALCRAEGIPARDVGGLMYCGDGLAAFGGHAWAEVVLDGRWVAVDPTWNQFPVDATHITLGGGGSGDNTLRFIAKMPKMQVIAVETDG